MRDEGGRMNSLLGISGPFVPTVEVFDTVGSDS
jgi:hypothetical protein